LNTLDRIQPWRLRARTLSLTGWRAWLLLFGAGVVSALAMAPLYFWPALSIGLGVLLWSVDGVHLRDKPLRTAFARGFMFALGYFMAGTFWVGFAFANRGPEFIPLIPLALPAFAGMLAAFWGGAMVLYVMIGQRSMWRILGFALSIALFEWLRGHIFTGLPWNLPAYAWPAGGAISQSASWFGVYGLSFLTIFALVSPAVIVGRGGYLTRLIPAAAGVVILLVLFWTGATRLASNEIIAQPNINIRIVQVAITQAEKWGPDGDVIARNRYLAYTAEPGLEDVTHVVWPEGAVPAQRAFMLEDVETLRMISDIIPDDTILLTGLSRRESPQEGGRYYNSLAVMNFHSLTPRFSLYDKVHLVPFGETVPFADLLTLIGFGEFARLTYSPGPGPLVMEIEGAPPMMPLICYEAIFPNFVHAAPTRPAWMFNLSNDAWFGDTSGPRQHLNQARYRAIETGLPIVRSASRGISGVVGPLGRMPVLIEPGEEGAYDVSLPQPIAETIYAKWGDGPFWLVVAGLLVGILMRRWRGAISRARTQP
jgi:apolipoprotein N-acyltransferase